MVSQVELRLIRSISLTSNYRRTQNLPSQKISIEGPVFSPLSTSTLEELLISVRLLVWFLYTDHLIPLNHLLPLKHVPKPRALSGL